MQDHPLHLVIDGADARGWVEAFCRNLARDGADVSCSVTGAIGENDRLLAMIVRAQSMLARTPMRLWLPSPPAPERWREPVAGAVILALSEGNTEADLTLWLDGERGIRHLGRMLVAGHVPVIEWRDRSGTIRACGRPAVERLDSLEKGLAHFLGRLTTLTRMAIRRTGGAPASLPRMRQPAGWQHPLMVFSRQLVGKFGKAIAPGRFRADHWRIAIRPLREAGRLVLPQDLSGFHWLDDDGRRYFADPVLWEDGDRTYLFMEEYCLVQQKGLISVTELGADGVPLYPPRRIIERASHLSYPQIFRHAGSIYMAPENAEDGHVPLYRARAFPFEWEECPALLPDTALHDATLIEREGSWFLLGNEERDGGSSWDCLCVYRAESPLGPFRPHPANPLLVDARLSRSAGPVLSDGSRLIRPVQNCVGGYGRSLVFTTITDLSEQGFSQQEISELSPPQPLSGLHSYTRSSRFEAIDLLTPRDSRPGL